MWIPHVRNDDARRRKVQARCAPVGVTVSDQLPLNPFTPHADANHFAPPSTALALSGGDVTIGHMSLAY
jgi:hypothetical protein